jgi:toxin CcdB
MEQYAVYENEGAGKKAYPYLLNIHHPFADKFSYTLMIPLIPLDRLQSLPPANLCPIITIETRQYVVMTHMMGGVSPREVGQCARQLDAEIYEIRDAFDFLLNGI